MPYSLSFLMSPDAAKARSKRNTKFVLHLEVVNASFNKDCMTEVDATDLAHAHRIACDWLINGRAHSVGIRRVKDDGSISKDVLVLDFTDFEREYEKLEAKKALNSRVIDYNISE